MDSSAFFSGAGVATITGIFGLWLKKMSKTESLEERLQRWQEETVKRVHSENTELRAKVDACEHKHAAQTQRSTVVEACIRLAIPALHRASPTDPALAQCGALLRALPINPDLPPDWMDLLDGLE